MGKQPYIPFYCGDYIKDTRKLPLAVRGAWMDLLLFMWDEEVKGEITDTIEGFATMLSCTKEEAEFALNLLMQKKVCSYEKMLDGRLKIISRRMKKDSDISSKRSKSGKKGFEARAKNEQNKNFASDLHNTKLQQIPEYGYDIENEDENKKGGTGERLLLCPEMVKIFKESYPSYADDQDRDFPACANIAYKIAKVRQWTKHSVTNGKLPDVLQEWRSIVVFSKSDSWYSTRAISDFDKEFQRLTQKKNNGGTANNSRVTEEKPTPTGNVATGGFGKLQSRRTD